MYFAGFPGAAVVDPSKIRSPAPSAKVLFTDVRVADKSVLYPLRDPDTGYRIRYDQNFAVSFSAFDFSNPAAVRYRYRIAPLETEWHLLPAALRTINFATLPTGTFTLVVEAATERGEWGGSGSLAIQVSPPWWYTWWFITLFCILAMAVIFAAYKARMMQVETLYNARLEERLGERTRVARDLHDTLLQSFQGLIYRLEGVRNLLPEEPGKASEMLNVILLKSDDAIVEGRETIQSLRDPAKATADIIKLIEEDAAELSSLQPDGARASFSLKVEGKLPRLPVEVRDELRQICREALRNAYFHSGAKGIECLLRFEGARMEITVSDNGKGMPSEPGEMQNSGHYGISGIMERAANIEAQLSISSQQGRGTKVTLKMNTTESKLRSISRDLVAHHVR
jgi:signal transduction histidine kinase